MAPPPTHYVSEAPAELDGASSISNPKEPRGKMTYPYQATGQGEVTVEEAQEVTIIESDGRSSPFPHER